MSLRRETAAFATSRAFRTKSRISFITEFTSFPLLDLGGIDLPANGKADRLPLITAVPLIVLLF